jgi:hypothetical protein
MPTPAHYKSTVRDPIRAAMVLGKVKVSPSIGTAVQAAAGARQDPGQLASCL